MEKEKVKYTWHLILQINIVKKAMETSSVSTSASDDLSSRSIPFMEN